jgi:hypothetical protein
MNIAAASAHVCPGMRIHAIDMVQPPGIVMPSAMDPHHQTVPAAASAEGVEADCFPVPHAVTPIATATATIVLHMMTSPI